MSTGNKGDKYKVVKLRRDTWEAVRILQIKLDLKSIDETIRYLITYYYSREREKVSIGK